MKAQFQPWQLLLLILAGWINPRQQVAVAEFLSHFPAERNHQGLGNRLIEPGEQVGRTAGDVACRERLGGMLRYYYRLCRDRNSAAKRPDLRRYITMAARARPS